MADNRKRLNFPSQDDVDGSVEALVRLQETYKLDVAEVAAGILNGVKYGFVKILKFAIDRLFFSIYFFFLYSTGMSWQDCFTLGQRLYIMEDYNHTKTWLKESMVRLNQEKYSGDPTALDYKESVAENLLVLGKVIA